MDDASTDRSFDLLSEPGRDGSSLKGSAAAANFGQTAALAAGFDEAHGDIIISLDGDLQHDPDDIPLLLEKIDEGYDIASGWRKNRVDNAVTRSIPSRIANWMMKQVSGVDLHDFGTTFKAYRSDVLKDVNYTASTPLYPGAGQFLWRAHRGSAIKNIERPNGESHYGLGPNIPRVLRHDNDQVPTAILDPAYALFRQMGIGRHWRGHLVLAYVIFEKSGRKRHHYRTWPPVSSWRHDVVRRLNAIQRRSDW